mgnify:CR=1 FL=1
MQGPEGLELFYMPVVKEYIIKGEYEKGISVSDEGLKKCDNDSPMAYMLYYAKYSAYDKLGNYTEARKTCPVCVGRSCRRLVLSDQYHSN